VLAETGIKLNILENLGFARCRLSLAVEKSVNYSGPTYFSGKRIATSYPNILQGYLDKNNVKAEIHVINGSVEIATGIGLADAIFDIVSSGSTLISNGLKEVEKVADSEAVLLSAPELSEGKMKTMDELLFRIRSVLAAGNNKYILLNAPDEKLDQIIGAIPGMKSPTVLPLAMKGWSSVHSVVNENDFWQVIGKLKEYGADGALLLVAIAWGLTFYPVQQAVEESPVYVFLFWRFLCATLLMALLAWKNLRKIDGASVSGGMFLGLFLFLGFAFQTFGLTYTYSSTVAFITGLNVVIVPFVVFIFFKKRATLYSSMGAIAAAIGLYLLSAQGEISAGLGELYALICAFMFALQISFTAHYVKHCNIYVLVVVQFAMVTLLSFLGAIVLDGSIMPVRFDGIFLEAIIITAVFATVFAFFVQTAMHTMQLLGALLILLGILIAELGTYWRTKRETKKAML